MDCFFSCSEPLLLTGGFFFGINELILVSRGGKDLILIITFLILTLVMSKKKFTYVVLNGPGVHITEDKNILTEFIISIDNPNIITFKNLESAKEWVTMMNLENETKTHSAHSDPDEPDTFFLELLSDSQSIRLSIMNHEAELFYSTTELLSKEEVKSTGDIFFFNVLKKGLQKAKELGIQKIHCVGNSQIMQKFEGNFENEINQIKKDFEFISFEWSSSY